MKNSKEYQLNKTKSRKWFLVLTVVILSTIGTFLPPIFSVWFLGLENPMVILSGMEYVSILTLVVSAYFGANVWQKHIVGKNDDNNYPTNNNSDDKEF